MNEKQLEKANQIIPECLGFWRIGMDNVIKEFIEFKHRMDEIDEFFFLTGGTCLGIARDGALIEWDRDLDIGIMSDESLYRIKEKLTKYYSVEIAKYNERGLNGYNGKRLWLKNRPMGETFEKKNWNGHGRAVWPKKLFDKFEKIEFAGEYFNVPSPVEEFLAILYGSDWSSLKMYKDWRYNCHNLFPGWK